MSNNIMKQNYDMLKAFEVLVNVKKKQFSRTNIIIQNRSITLNKQAFFDFKNIFLMPISQYSGLISTHWQIGRLTKLDL